MHNEVTYTIRFGEKELKILTDMVKASKTLEKRLIQMEKDIKEIKKMALKQSDVDALTEQITANTAAIRQAAVEEKDEVLAAIAATNLNTDALETAIVDSTSLSDDVKNIYVAPEPPPA